MQKSHLGLEGRTEREQLVEHRAAGRRLAQRRGGEQDRQGFVLGQRGVEADVVPGAHGVPGADGVDPAGVGPGRGGRGDHGLAGVGDLALARLDHGEGGIGRAALVGGSAEPGPRVVEAVGDRHVVGRGAGIGMGHPGQGRPEMGLVGPELDGDGALEGDEVALTSEDEGHALVDAGQEVRP